MNDAPESSPKPKPRSAPAVSAPRRPPGLRTAQDHHKAGRLAEAESAYRQWLSRHPADAAALHGLGLVNHQAGRQHEAVALLRQAVRAVGSGPKAAEYRSNLAAVLGRQGRHAEAAAELAEAVRVRPDYAEGHCNLGVALEHSGRKEEAAAAYRRAIALKADYAQAYNSLGNCLRKLRRVDEAESAYREAVRLRPNHAGAYSNLAAVLSGQGRLAEVIECRRQVAELRPGSASAGSALLSTLHYAASSSPAMLLEMARRWAGKHGRVDGSTKSEARGTKEIQSTKVEIQNGNAPSPQPSPGVPGEGENVWSRGSHVNDRDTNRRLRVGFISSNLSGHPEGRFLRPVLANLSRTGFETTCYSAGPRADAVTALLRQLCDRWRDIHKMGDEHVAAGTRQDRIDILVDLTGHFGGNRLGVFARKPAPVQVIHFGYPGTTGMEAMDWRVTDEYADPFSDGKHEIRSTKHETNPRSEEEMTETAELNIAMRATERSSDLEFSPSNLFRASNFELRASTQGGYATERLLRLPGLAWVYDEPLEARAVGPLPAERNGFVTFLCANNPLKVTPEAVAAWAKVLGAVPGSRLTMLLDEKGPQSARRERPSEPRPSGSGDSAQDRSLTPEARREEAIAGRWLREAFAGHGIDPSRISFAGRQSRGAYFAWIGSADIALDPFPYNGGVTTCDTLWMGVPVVSLRGHAYWSRQGLALLSNVGHPELAAPTQDGYVEAAVALAGDLPRLAGIRKDLRERVRRSAIVDAAGFARKLEAAYRQIWRAWCES